MDPRLTALAKQLIRYSVNLKRDERILLDLSEVPDAFAVALIREVRRRKGIPVIRQQSAAVSRELLLGATEDQFRLISKGLLAEMKSMQAYIAVRGSHNIAEISDVPPARMEVAMQQMRKVTNHRVAKTRWCVLRWPHPAMAQQAGMSTEAFEDFYFRVCLLDYKALLPAMNALKRLMEKTESVRLVGPGTDLSFSIADIPAVVCGGNYNIPDGEVFTAPVRNSVEGVLSYNAPSIYRGIPFDGVRLEFKNGKIVKATAAGGKTRALKKILDSDPGARYIGEFALGFNPEIKEPMRDILFDEKIAGSFHFTPGQAYEEADNGNRSQVHWDLVNIQRPDYGGGEVLFDDKLIRQDGQFLAKNLQKLNW